MSWSSRLNPINWIRRALTADQFAALGLYTPPAAGVVLTPEVALGISAVYCADRVIAEDLASLPILAYEGSPIDDHATPLPNHPVTKLVNDPNPEQTGPVFWAALQHDANFWGFGLAEIAWNGAGQAAELWHVPAPQAKIRRENGALAVYAPGPDGQDRRLALHDVILIPGFSPDGSVGYSLLNLARLTLGSAAAIQQFTAARFRNGFRPAGAIKVAGVLSDLARENMRKSWQALYGGVENAGAPMLLEEGATWEPYDMAHNDQLQLAELAENMVSEVARLFNISPVKLHQLGRATWSNLETLNRDHVVTTLGPWIAKRNAELTRKLCGRGVHVRHVVDRLLTADTATRFTAWNSAVQAGWMAPNEARAREDLPPKPGGDDLLRPLNKAPAGDPVDDQAGAGTPPPTPPPEAPTDGTDRTDPPQPAG